MAQGGWKFEFSELLAYQHHLPLTAQAPHLAFMSGVGWGNVQDGCGVRCSSSFLPTETLI